MQTVYNEIKATESSAQLADIFTEGIRLDIFILLQTRYWVGEIQKYNEPLGRSVCIRAPVVHLFMVIFTLSGWECIPQQYFNKYKLQNCENSCCRNFVKGKI